MRLRDEILRLSGGMPGACLRRLVADIGSDGPGGLPQIYSELNPASEVFFESYMPSTESVSGNPECGSQDLRNGRPVAGAARLCGAQSDAGGAELGSPVPLAVCPWRFFPAPIKEAPDRIVFTRSSVLLA